jgi:hypothetical protein
LGAITMTLRTAFRRSAVVVSLVAVTAGCGDGGSSYTYEQFMTDSLADQCHKVFTCCDSAEIAMLDPSIVDEASCRAYFATSNNSSVASARALNEAGRATYQSDRARACFDARVAVPCANWGGLLTSGHPPIPACDQVLVGTLAEGSSCDSNVECATNYCSGFVCVAPMILGQACEPSSCVAGLACVIPRGGGSGACQQPLPEGSACLNNSDCATGFCIPDSAFTASCGLPTMCDGL